MLDRMRSKGNTPPLLVGMKICTTTLEISIVVCQRIRNKPTERPIDITLGNIPKGCSIILQVHLFNYVHSSIIRNSQNPEITLMTVN